MTFHRRDFIKPADQEKAHRAYRSEYRPRLPGFLYLVQNWKRPGGTIRLAFFENHLCGGEHRVLLVSLASEILDAGFMLLETA
ncbi:hypothetical protein QM306_06560 [Burkholderia cenocepacia]|nr:hypothetical protein [Burkholderia cenocepacia]